MIKKIISVISAAVLLLGIADISAFAQGDSLSFLSDCNNTGIEVSAASAILIEAKTGTVLFSKNEKEHRQIASTTKIMTALLTLEAGDIDRQFTVDSTAIKVEGTSMGLREGDIVTRRALCYGMLLPSGNDAANAAAVNISGSKSSFAELMNKRAKQLGMSDTNFVTPSGLDAEGQYSCAYDLAILTREAMNNKDFADICCLSTAKISFGSPPYDRWLVNSNKLLTSYEGCIGVKTGFTDSARRTLVSAAQRDGITLIAVTLNAPNDWQDHTKLLDYGFSKVSMSDTSYETSMLKLPVISSDKEYVGIECETIKLPLCEEQKDKLEAQVILPKFVYAHITAGEQLGEVRFSLNGNIIGTAKLLAAESCTAQKQNNDFFTVIYKFITSLLAW
ncbi:MAG: D-alanyl-D-alanine carboxypeptidase family protein [Ruminiclostridium sp.]